MAVPSCASDVVIVGGGPAGLAAAIAARLRGFQVTVLDAAQPPIDKACGEGLMPDALLALERLGIALTPADGAPFVGLRFVAGAHSVSAEFPHGVGLGVRRPHLHQRLIDRAEALGVRLHWGTPVHRITPHVVGGTGPTLAYRWLLLADGIHSTLRRCLDLPAVPTARRRLGFRCRYRLAPWSAYVEVYWHARGQVCITPVGPDEVCVALLTHEPRLRLSELGGLFPHLAARLHGATPTTAVRGALTGTSRLARIYRGPIALVGDAAGAIDAITGEGLCLALQQAEPLAEALVAGDLGRYAAARHHLLRRPRMMAALLGLLDGRPWLQQRTLHALALAPDVFAGLLAWHLGQETRRPLGWRAPLAFGWRWLVG